MIEYKDVYRLTGIYTNSQLLVILRDMTVANEISVDAKRYIFGFINRLAGSLINKHMSVVCEIYFNLNTPLLSRLQRIAIMSFECGDVGVSIFKSFEKQDYQELLTPLMVHLNSPVDRSIIKEYIRVNPFIDTNEFMTVFDRLYNKQRLLHGGT